MTLDFDNDKNNTFRQLIVMGNGFDLQCGMPTRYQHFFDYRFGISLQSEINKYLKNGSDARTKFYKNLYNELSKYFDKTVGPKIGIQTFTWEELESGSYQKKKEKSYKS